MLRIHHIQRKSHAVILRGCLKVHQSAFGAHLTTHDAQRCFEVEWLCLRLLAPLAQKDRHSSDTIHVSSTTFPSLGRGMSCEPSGKWHWQDFAPQLVWFRQVQSINV